MSVRAGKLTTIDRDWTPVRRGKTYCSPGCGFDCLFADFERATHDADVLAARMGEGWKPVVWENGGWHYRVENGIATIYAHRTRNREGGSYSAWLEIDREGANTLQVIVYADTAEDALGIATQQMRTLEVRIRDALADLNGSR